MIRRTELDRALLLVQRSRVDRELETLLRPAGAGGRPRRLGMDVFLAGVILTAIRGSALALSEVHKTLTTEISRSARIQIGTCWKTSDGRTQDLTVRQVRYLLEAIERKLAFTQGRVADLSDADREARSAALQNICDRLLAATRPAISPLPTVWRWTQR